MTTCRICKKQFVKARRDQTICPSAECHKIDRIEMNRYYRRRERFSGKMILDRLGLTHEDVAEMVSKNRL